MMSILHRFLEMLSAITTHQSLSTIRNGATTDGPCDLWDGVLLLDVLLHLGIVTSSLLFHPLFSLPPNIRIDTFTNRQLCRPLSNRHPNTHVCSWQGTPS